MENVFYRNQLATAEHARALTLFQAKTPSQTVAARVIGDSTVSTAKAVFIDRGSTSNIEKGMAVVTPDGIVGKVAAVYPLVFAGSAGDGFHLQSGRGIAKGSHSRNAGLRQSAIAWWSKFRTRKTSPSASGFSRPVKIVFSREAFRWERYSASRRGMA